LGDLMQEEKSPSFNADENREELAKIAKNKNKSKSIQ